MIWWVSYDISNARRLRNVAKLCQRAGLQRIQKSVYMGELSQTQVILLRERLLQWIRADADRVLIFPLSEWCVHSAVSVGENSGIAELVERKEIIFV